MTKKLLVPSAFCILAIALLVILLSPKDKDGSNATVSSTESTPAKASTDSPTPGKMDAKTRRERENPGAAQARHQLEKEFDELLPARFPEQFSSICDVTLEPGESLILGGFKKSDGNYEFTMITVDPNVSGELKGQYTTKAKTMVLSPERSSELGFDALVSPARTRIQKGLVLDTETIIRSISSGHYVGFMTSPSITNPANRSASIDLGYGEGSLVIAALVTRDGEGGSIRLRTRIESPDDSYWATKSR